MLCVLTLAVLTCPANAIAAQSDNAGASATPDSAEQEAPREVPAQPRPISTGAAFGLALEAMRNWSPCQRPDDWDGTIDDALGFSINIRIDGEPLARVTQMVEDAEGEAAFADAVDRAVRAASLRLSRNLPDDVNIDAVRRAAADRISLDIQFAGPLVPLDAASLDEAIVSLRPGLDGVAGRSGSKLAYLFPVDIIATGRTNETALRAVIADLDLPPDDLQTLRNSHGLQLYRFGVRHIAKIPAARFPIDLHRGGRIVETNETTRPAIVSASRALAGHLVARRAPDEAGPIGMSGPYDAALDRYEPAIASPRSQALAAYALARLGEVRGVPLNESAVARNEAWRLIADLLDVTDAETPMEDQPGASAAWLLAWSELAATTPPRSLDRAAIDRHAERTLNDVLAALEARKPEDSAARALAVFAVARAAPLISREPREALQTADAALRSLLAAHPAGRLPALMPWLLLAELELHPPLGNPYLSGDAEEQAANQSQDDAEEPSPGGSAMAPLPSRDVLLEMRSLSEGFQLREVDTGERDRDLIGGLVFTRGGTPLPTWHTLRVMPALAAMLGDPRLTEREEFHDRAAPVQRGIRFAINLAVTEAEAHCYPSPRRALGGVRLAIWDPTITPDATALALITMIEAIESTDRRLPAQKPTDRTTR